MTLTLIAQALDRFPHLTQLQRADLFSAIDLAPVSVPDPQVFAIAPSDEEIAAHEWYEAYYKGPAHAAWMRVREFWMTPIDLERPYQYHMTLHEAAGYESCPTHTEILKALDRAARYAKENA